MPKGLTLTQADCLYRLHEECWWHEGTTKAHGNTLNSLKKRGFVKRTRYSDGYHWEVTETGREIVFYIRSTLEGGPK